MSEELQEKMKSIFEKEKLNEFKKQYEKTMQNELKDYENNNIYPLNEDPNFILKISSKKEFQDTKYDGTVKKNIEEIKKYSDFLCNTKFELNPHQSFVKNFLSFQTPYNSLLLYHGLGSGKTCTAIGVAEEMRNYLKQLNINRRIIVVASPNVQENFKLQLFDERKLELNNGYWNLNACTGNELLNEINPMNIKGITKEKITKQINQIINKYYTFMGYTKFANYIDKAIGEQEGKSISNVSIKKIKKMFEDRLIIIDEVHNIRSVSSKNEEKRISNNLNKLVKYTDNLHLLLLSATPIYNNYKEIVYLINLLNLNDKKSEVKVSEIFDNDGNFIMDEGYEIGKQKFIEKTRGFVSFVRGDNPYTFPFRIFPYEFDKEKSLKTISYPRLQFNETDIIEPLQFIDTYNIKIGNYQNLAYEHVINNLVKKSNISDINDQNITSLGYSKLQIPIELLNMTYPNIDFDDNYSERKEFTFVGKKGLSNIMTFEENNEVPYRSNFKYKDNYLNKYGRIFSKENIGKYSCKISEIINNIENSNGISLVYSQYIDGGITPVVLALEELGYSRYGDVKSLYSDEYKRKLKIQSTNKKYIMITGDKYFSPSKYRNEELKAITNDNNKNGEQIKVVFISKSGSEGIDFKFIRNVHIMEPWYNMNRLEQIIGRAVRNCSHKLLPLEERNVCIYFYATLLENNLKESIDHYVYRLAEKKAIQIGNITRTLKESSIDCLLNIEQNNFSFEKMTNIEIPINLSNKKNIIFKVGDKPYTSICDYQDTCYYKCLYINDDKIDKIDKIPKKVDNTYNLTNMLRSNNVLINKIRQLFQEKYFYTKKDLFFEINKNKDKEYPKEQIYSALNKLIENKNNFLLDKYDRIGHLINVEDLYIYQPSDFDDTRLNMYERINTQNNKASMIRIKPNEVKYEEERERPSESYNYNINIEEIQNIYDSILQSKNNSLDKNNFTLNHISQFINDDKILKKLIIHHVFDYLHYSKKIGIIEYFQQNEEKGFFEKELKKYSDNYLIKNDIAIGFIHPLKNDDYELYVKYNDEDNWKKGKEGDRKNILNNIKSKYLITNPDNNEDTIGFIVNFLDKNSNNYLLKLKIKNMSDNKSTGITFDSAPKRKAVQIISSITNNNFIDSIKSIPNERLSLFVELILRYKNLTKLSFMTPNEYIINKMFNKNIKL